VAEHQAGLSRLMLGTSIQLKNAYARSQYCLSGTTITFSVLLPGSPLGPGGPWGPGSLEPSEMQPARLASITTVANSFKVFMLIIPLISYSK
jgi:hypothetical protein